MFLYVTITWEPVLRRNGRLYQVTDRQTDTSEIPLLDPILTVQGKNTLLPVRSEIFVKYPAEH